MSDRLVTFGDMIQEMEARMDNNAIRSSVKRWLNTSYKNLAMSIKSPLHRKMKTLSTVSGTDTYDLPSDFRCFGHLNDAANKRLLSEDFENILYLRDTEARSGDPEQYAVGGIDPERATYTTGTISKTDGSNILTGASTSWTTNVTDGDLITIGSEKYNVYRVNSTTEIVMCQKALTTQAGSTYTIERMNMAQLILYPKPSAAGTIKYHYYKRTHDMVHDNDIPELPEEFNEGIVQGALMQAHQYDEEEGLASISSQAYKIFLDKWAGYTIDLRESDFNSGIGPLGYSRDYDE